MILNLNNLAEVGYVADIQPQNLPPNAFSSALNTRFIDFEIRRVLGEQGWNTLGQEGYFLMPYPYVDDLYWLTAGSTNIQVWQDGSATDITPSEGIAGRLNPPWTGFMFNGIAVMNNGVNEPLYWVPGETEAAVFPAWDSLWRAKVMSSFKNMIVMFNLTEDGVRYPTKYRWSAFADPGALPSSWDETDATIAAGSDVLDATQQAIIAAEPLGDYLVAYTRDSAHLLSFVGGAFTLAERPLLKKQGCLATHCVKEFFKKHFVLRDGDVYVHDGQSPESICRNRVYKKIFPTLDPDTFERCFVTPNWRDEEMWCCVPESGASRPNVAVMWNWRNNTWSVRELTTTAHIAHGRLPSDAPDTTHPVEKQLVAIQDLGGGLYPAEDLYPALDLYPADGTYKMVVMESSYQKDGVDMTCSVERTGLQPEPHDGTWLLRAAFPIMEGGTAEFYFGKHDSPNAPVTWSGPYSFSPEGAEDKIDTRVTGKYLAWRAILPADEAGAITEMRFDVVQVGNR